MGSISRVVVTALTALAVFYFTFYIAGGLLTAAHVAHGGRASWIALGAVSAVLAVLAAGFVWRRSAEPGSLATSILVNGFKTGAIGFSIGFFGPMLLSPGANQGPLLGILILGPAGFLLGAFGGYIRWAAARARASGPPPPQR